LVDFPGHESTPANSPYGEHRRGCRHQETVTSDRGGVAVAASPDQAVAARLSDPGEPRHLVPEALGRRRSLAARAKASIAELLKLPDLLRIADRKLETACQFSNPTRYISGGCGIAWLRCGHLIIDDLRPI
jgi:hypothetical protein